MRRPFRRRSSDLQQVFPFLTRIERRDRQFRRAILIATLAAIAVIALASADLRFWIGVAGYKLRDLALLGIAPPSTTRPFSDDEWTARRTQKVRKAEQALESFLANSSPQVVRLFEASGMGPGAALHRWGRGDQVFMFSNQVFEADEHGRSYRLRPNSRSVWLRELIMKGGPHGLLLIPDRPELRALASKAGAIVVEDSVQNTNSWGLRGAEPRLGARVRVMVLGDSFMEGMFIGDSVTPPIQLERELAKLWGCEVCVLNTGHVGYSPEQYYYTYLEYVERFRPHFLVISVCHNDFGDDGEVLGGRGDLYGEAAYWINRIIEDCRGKNLGFLLVPVPHRENVDVIRGNGHYPGRLLDDVSLAPKLVISLLDDFIDENLRLKKEEPEKVAGAQTSVLFNASIQDGHFSALGSALWARLVARRITRVIDPANLPRQFYRASTPADSSRRGDALPGSRAQ